MRRGMVQEAGFIYRGEAGTIQVRVYANSNGVALLSEKTHMSKKQLPHKKPPMRTHRRFAVYIIDQKIPSPPMAAISPANTMETIESSLIRMFTEGPAVSLKGSPTVSPTTAAL